MAVEALWTHKRAMLAEGNAASPFVFCDTWGGPLRSQNVLRRSFWLAAAAGFSAATLLFNVYRTDTAGVSPDYIPQAKSRSRRCQGVLPGDFNTNGAVDAADYVVWRDNFGMQSGAMSSMGDGDSDGDVDGNDYLVWQSNFGRSTSFGASANFFSTSTIPEPSCALTILVGLFAINLHRGDRRGAQQLA